MKKRFIFPVFLLAMMMAGLLFTAGAWAATYYVSPSGSDNNSGSSNSPFQTIQHAANIVQPGDTVIVENGTYTGTVTVSASGTSSAWITFEAANKWGAVLDGQSNSTSIGWIFNSGVHNIRVQGFKLTGFSLGGFWMAVNAGTSNIYMQNDEIQDIGNYYNTSLYGEPGIFIGSNNNYITVDGCVIHDIGRTGGLPNPNHDHGIYDEGNYLTVMNSIFYNCTEGWQVLTDADHISIVNNVFYGENPGEPGQIIVQSDMPGSISSYLVQNNISYGSNTSFVYFYGTNGSGISLLNNLVYSASLSGGSSPSFANTGNIINQNPLFVDPSNYDFQLQSSSPAIRAGLAWSGRTYDANGNTVLNPPDIGAYEYEATLSSSSSGGTGSGTGSTGSTSPTATSLAPSSTTTSTSTSGTPSYQSTPSNTPPGTTSNTTPGTSTGTTAIAPSSSGTASVSTVSNTAPTSTAASSGSASASGSTSATATSPAASTVTNGTSSGSASAPQVTAPQLLTPSQGQTVSTTVTLQWSPAKDSSPCTYTLYIGTTSDFSNASPIQVASSQSNTYAMGGGAAALLMFGLAIPGWTRRRRRLAMLLLAGVIAAGFLVSCGGGGAGSNTSSSSPASSVSPSAGAMSYTVSGLSGKTTYYWKVVAQDNAGNTVQSQTGSFQTS